MDSDKNTLRQLADNQPLMDALKRVLDAHFSLDAISLGMTNDEIGQVVRANLMGRAVIAAALKEIVALKTVSPAVVKPNPGR